MAIGDLLAQISGEKKGSPDSSASRPTAATGQMNGALKRRAVEELAAKDIKILKTTTSPNVSSRTNGDKASSSPRAAGGNSQRSSTTAVPRISNGQTSSATSVPRASGLSKPVPSGQNRPSTKPAVGGSKPSAVPSATGSKQPPTSVHKTSTSQPKKGSYAEIMARASKMQQTMGPVGRIQHKSIKSTTPKRVPDEDGAAGRKQSRKSNVRGGGHRAGSNRDRPAAEGKNPGTGPKSSKGANASKGPRGKAVEEVPAKKIKKAALATTGYTGTARPSAKPAASGSKPSNSRGHSQRERPFGALGGLPRRQDEYDEELDDFIEYDDDEPEETRPRGYGRGGYSSDEEDESDMEAGMSDIDEEERRADFAARREDLEQEALEKRLKREKEDRKRRLMGSRV